MNRYDYIYREASFNYKQGHATQKPTYLKLMLDVTKNLIDLIGLNSLKDSQEEAERKEQLKKKYLSSKNY
jgi:hypothetical protein